MSIAAKANALWEYANPRKFLATSERVMPFFWITATVCIVVGLVWGFFLHAG